MKKLNKLFKKSYKIYIDDTSKLVIMSDCHRGNGSNYDNFIKNKNIYESALNYYYNNNFIYVELGDGDEMWEVKDYNEIIETHLSTFKQLKKFNDSKRLIMLYGNHDMYKKSDKFVKKYFYKYYDKVNKKEKSLLNKLKVHESLILDYKGYEILLIHGHQVDFLNSVLWKISKFLVRHVWRILEHLSIKDLTSAARNNKIKNNVEIKLKKWSKKNNKMVISGHTHRATFPKIGESLYFNDGSCIHPNGITCLEIEQGNITLVKWEFKLHDEKLLSIGREIIEGSESIKNYYE